MGAEEEPDYEAIWERIKAQAESWQSRWYREPLPQVNHPEAYVELWRYQRRASQAAYREAIQRLDLADAINRGDIAGYILRWYPEAVAPPPDPERERKLKVIFRAYDEAIDREFGVIRDQEEGTTDQGLRTGRRPASSTATKPNSTSTASTRTTQSGGRRILATQQPMGGKPDGSAAHLKRARRLSTTFPPGTLVSVEWDYGPEFGNPGLKSGTGTFTGVVDEYDKSGWLTAYSEEGEKLWIPCGKIRINAV